MPAGGLAQNMDEEAFKAFLEAHTRLIAPLSRQSALAYFEATQTGKKEAYERYADLSLAERMIYADQEAFRRIEAFKDSGKVQDPVLARQLELLYNAFLANQIPLELLERITRKEASVEETFNTFPYEIDSRPVSNNEITRILKEETDSGRLEKAYEAQKAVGKAVAPELLELIKLRNEAARGLGFSDYYTMSLKLDEQDASWVHALFGELKTLTDSPYKALKETLDEALSVRYGIPKDALMPWHYQDPFFQAAPEVFGTGTEALFKGKDVVELAKFYYASLGIPVYDILSRSQPITPAPGKNPHAYAIDIDRSGDIRVFLNVENDAYWMDTLLHELGHAAYDRYIDPALPYTLRIPAHTFVTEAIAMFFERLPKTAAWLRDMGLLNQVEAKRLDPGLKAALRADELVFARWDMVMTRFEKALYEDPDQDLDALWWRLVQDYQGLTPPKRKNPDWAAKIHFSSSPAYYHNYLLGELLASQLYAKILDDVVGAERNAEPSLVAEPRLKGFLTENIFRYGAKYRWDDLIEKALGQPLSPEAFIRQFGEMPEQAPNPLRSPGRGFP